MAKKRKALSEVPDQLDPISRAKIRLWTSTHYPLLYLQLSVQWHKFVDWHKANGVLRADFEAAFRNWLRKAHEFSAREATKHGTKAREGDRGGAETLGAILRVPERKD